MATISPEFSFTRTVNGDLTTLLSKEWLVTNGLGGYASSSLLGIATRRYHGLFVPDLPGRGRTVIIPRLDETIERGGDAILLSGAEYADGRIDTDGLRHLKDMRREWQTPVWVFEVEGSVLEKRIVAPHGQNTIYLQYNLTQGPPICLLLRPFVTFRLHDARLTEGQNGPFSMTISEGRYEIPLPDGAPSLKLGLRPRCGQFVSDELVSGRVSYLACRARGSDCVLGLFCPGYFAMILSVGGCVALVASVVAWELLEFVGDDILQAERRRLEQLAALAPDLGLNEFSRH